MTIQKPSSTRSWLAVLAMAAILPACGGGSSNSPTPPVTQAPQPTRTLVGSGNFTLLSTGEAQGLGYPQDVFVVPFSVTGSGTGTVEVVADWTFASSDVDIWFMTGACSPQQAAVRQCPIRAETTSTTTKPERLTVTGVGVGTYSIGFANYTNRAESGNFQVFLTR